MTGAGARAPRVPVGPGAPPDRRARAANRAAAEPPGAAEHWEAAAYQEALAHRAAAAHRTPEVWPVSEDRAAPEETWTLASGTRLPRRRRKRRSRVLRSSIT